MGAPLTKIAITIQKIDFWPQISKFLGQKSTFSPLATNWSLTDQCFQHEKGVSLDSQYEDTKIFTPCPPKIGFWAQKQPNFAQNWHFGPKIDADKLSRLFSVMLVPKLLLTPIKIKIFGPKTANFGPNIAIFAHFVQCPTKKQCEQGAQVGFLLCG